MSEEKDTAVSPDAAEQPKDTEGTAEVQKNPARPKEYVLVNHMMKSARSGLKRHARSGNRRQGVILDNGQRIRKRGYRMMNEVNLRTMVASHRRLLDYLESGIIEVIDPVTSKALTVAELIKKIEEVGSRATPGEKMKVDWAPSAVDPKPDSTQPNMEVAEELAKSPEATGESEEVVGDGEPEQGLTEEELLKLSRSDLNDTAREYGVDNPEGLKNKQEVVDAIFEAQAGEEG
jgi:hypothetical protein